MTHFYSVTAQVSGHIAQSVIEASSYRQDEDWYVFVLDVEDGTAREVGRVRVDCVLSVMETNAVHNDRRDDVRVTSIDATELLGHLFGRGAKTPEGHEH